MKEVLVAFIFLTAFNAMAGTEAALPENEVVVEDVILYTSSEVSCTTGVLKIEKSKLLTRTFLISKTAISVKSNGQVIDYNINVFDKNTYVANPKDVLLKESFFLKVTDEGKPVSINELDTGFGICGGGLVVTSLAEDKI